MGTGKPTYMNAPSYLHGHIDKREACSAKGPNVLLSANCTCFLVRSAHVYRGRWGWSRSLTLHESQVRAWRSLLSGTCEKERLEFELWLVNWVTRTKFNTALREDVRMKRALETVTCWVYSTNGVDSRGNADRHDGDIDDCLLEWPIFWLKMKKEQLTGARGKMSKANIRGVNRHSDSGCVVETSQGISRRQKASWV